VRRLQDVPDSVRRPENREVGLAVAVEITLDPLVRRQAPLLNEQLKIRAFQDVPVLICRPKDTGIHLSVAIEIAANRNVAADTPRYECDVAARIIQRPAIEDKTLAADAATAINGRIGFTVAVPISDQHRIVACEPKIFDANSVR